MLNTTLGADFQKVRSVNCTDTSFPSKVPTNTEPTGDAGTAGGASVIDLSQGNIAVHNGVALIPYGLGDENDVFAMRIIGWKRVGTVAATLLWIPVTLAELTCTMGTSVGVAAMTILNTERFCDTIVLVTGNDDVSIDIVSPADNTIAHVMMDVKGFKKLEVCFDMTTGSPTSANCLYAPL